MNAFWGADTDALRTMGTVYSRRAEAISDLAALLASSIDSIEWIGEDADRFRADWSGVVRPSLQDQEVELRQRARRLAQHADEQEAASAPDGPFGGFGGGSGGGVGGGWSSPGEFLRDLLGLVGEALHGPGGGQGGPFAELLREVLGTREGRDAFLGAFLGALQGGLLADMLRSASGMGLALESLLAGLGLTGALGHVIGESGQLPPQGPMAAEASAVAESGGGAAPGAGEGSVVGAADQSPGGDSAAGSGGSASGSGETGGGSGSGGGSGAGGGTGSGGGSGGGTGGGEAAADSGAGTGAEGAVGADGEAGGSASDASAAGRTFGAQGVESGPAQSAGSGAAGRLVNDTAEGPRSLLERLLDMLGDALDTRPGNGSVIGDSIGRS